MERAPDGSFVEDGTITYGRAGSVTFDTVGRGHVGPAPDGRGSHGVVMWRITGGDGRFAGAQGLITSNFTVTPDGAGHRRSRHPALPAGLTRPLKVGVSP